ncbi:MAG: hypothetical protein O9264_18590 [Leptospira sp.]|nr:hypothetical protein [Leptospira sp.]
MSKGYHSKSPEEFREYLKSIGNQKSKFRWRQIVILLDIFLLIFVIYLVFRSLNPGSFEDPTQSAKQIIDGNPMYLALSREVDDTNQGYFLFIENNTNQDQIFPDKNWEGEFRILTKEGVVCFSEKVKWDSKTIPKFSKGFLYHSLSLKNLQSIAEPCYSEIFDVDYTFFRSKFRNLTLSFSAQILLVTEKSQAIFQIKQKPYRIKKEK